VIATQLERAFELDSSRVVIQYARTFELYTSIQSPVRGSL
jgi:hypothetical protein